MLKTDIMRRGSISDICAKRDHVLRLIKEAKDLLDKANDISKEINHMSYSFVDSYLHQSRYGLNFEDARKYVDERVWRYLINVSGLRNVMDREALQSFERDLEKNPPEVSEKNVRDTLGFYMQSIDLVFERGLVNAFRSAFLASNRKYKSNDRFKIGKKLCYASGFDYSWGWWGGWSGRREELDDIHRCFYILDNKKPPEDNARASSMVASERKQGNDVWQDDYLKIRVYKKGSIHIEFLRSDLVDKANEIIAKHHDHQLPDTRT